MLTREQLQRAAAENGFPVDSLEKVWMLVRLLNMMVAQVYAGSATAAYQGVEINGPGCGECLQGTAQLP